MRIPMKNLLLLKAGEVALPLRLVAGDYDRWFFEAFGFSKKRFTVVHASMGQRVPALTDFDGVIISGSPLSVTALAPWMASLGRALVEAAARKVPILGVCFGHQLLGHAFGAKVVRNPAGREIGSVEVSLTAAGLKDPLFEGVPPRFCVQATHEDILGGLPRKAVALAGNANTALQAMAIGDTVRGVQFHPELSAAGARAVIEARRERLDAEGVAAGEAPSERPRRLLAGIQPSPFGARILENFLRHFT